MRVALGSDHRGDNAALALFEHLRKKGHEVVLMGECNGQSRDYPDHAWQVSSAVGAGAVERGILLCSNGVGMAIAANKVPSVRAALIYDEVNAEQCRRHNDANVLCLGGETNPHDELFRIVDVFLRTPFDGGRHARRVGKIAAIERGEDPRGVAAAQPARS